MKFSELISTRVEQLAGQYGIRLILQFGSTVTGAVHPRSDIDIAVLLTYGDISFQRRGEIRQGIQECFPDHDVDLAILNRADPLLLKKIMERCRLLYGSDRALQKLRIYAFKRYQDHRRLFALERRYVERGLSNRTAAND